MKILIFGFGVTGIASAKAFDLLDIQYDILDKKSIGDICEIVEREKVFPKNLYNDIKDVPFEEYDFILKSPGIRLYHKWVKDMVSRKCSVVSDIELAYEWWKERKFICITGTNGKTTTTALLGKFLEGQGYTTHVTGNIGKGVLWDFAQGGDEDQYVIETSSFQLEFVRQFAPQIAGILNITPDHLDWHGSMESYIQAKMNLLRKQNGKDIAVLNWDDEILKREAQGLASTKHWISQKERVYGYYLEDEYIVEDLEKKIPLVSTDIIHIPGAHNVENILMAIGLARAAGVTKEVIEKTLDAFYGVEHRIELVKEEAGVRYYNDSKGANVDASIKAIEAFDNPLILIAGGYDKHVPLDAFFEAFGGKVKKLILLGQTAKQFEETGRKHGFYDSILVHDMKEAVNYAKKIAQSGDVVLLSPASASWGMYRNFEERGKEFKALVKG